MKIAVASGKGGTGKTTIATSLAISLAGDSDVWYIDCDVEAPNGHLFLKPAFAQQSQAVIRIPQVQVEQCTLCGKCVEVCQFHALAKVGKIILVFPQLCHGCGSCTWNCPQAAISEIPNSIGIIETGTALRGIHFGHGKLTISEPMPTPVIRQLKQQVHPPTDAVVIFDAPPGASCSVVETLRGSDFVLLVSEPTPFGLHDLRQMIGIVQEMRIPAGIIINRENGPYAPLLDFCTDHHLPVLMRIPFERTIAQGIAEGKTLTEIDPAYGNRLRAVFNQIQRIHTASGQAVLS
jgi:MinD superfamily P-loop ATPase